jgi:hypothetical protein
MDQQTNKQEPSGKEGGQVNYKRGDKVWLLCEVDSTYKDQSCLYMDVHYDGIEIEATLSDCRPVEPPTKQPTQGQKLAERTMKAIWAANHSVSEPSAIKQSLTPEFNSPETPDSSSDPINPAHYKQGGVECIEAIKAALGEGFPDYIRGNVMKYLWRYKEKGGVDDLKKAAWYLDRLFKEVGE